MEQQVIYAHEPYRELDEYFTEHLIKKLFLVCGGSIRYLKLDHYFQTLFERTGVEVIRFSDFEPNPKYESVVSGVELFRQEACDAIIAVGGGSAMDVAKCIKLYSDMAPDKNYLEQRIEPNAVKLFAVPTTAGTGSEATRFAVIYYKGEKQSVTDESCIPSMVLMDESVLKHLSVYQKKAAMLDALCHAVESYWSVNSTDESKEYSKRAIRLILDNMDEYLNEKNMELKEGISTADVVGTEAVVYEEAVMGMKTDVRAKDAANVGEAMNTKEPVIPEKVIKTDTGKLDVDEVNANMQKAAYLAGKAINITQTTAGHAMCYKLTSLYGIAHGHAAALCVAKLFPYMVEHTEKCIDPRGAAYLQTMFGELAEIMGCEDPHTACGMFTDLLERLDMNTPKAQNADYEVLKTSVNPVRLKNNPVRLEEDVIDELYHAILK